MVGLTEFHFPKLGKSNGEGTVEGGVAVGDGCIDIVARKVGNGIIWVGQGFFEDLLVVKRWDSHTWLLAELVVKWKLKIVYEKVSNEASRSIFGITSNFKFKEAKVFKNI